MINTCERCGGLYSTDPNEWYAGTPCGCGVPKGGECRIARIIIPSKAPPGVVEALRNFVNSIEEYDRSGVWPDNWTLRKLATEGREALNAGTEPSGAENPTLSKGK